MTDRRIDAQKTVPPPPKKKRNRVYRRERRERERAEREKAFIHDAQWATQSSGAPSSTLVPDRLTQLGLPHSDPISAMRPAVYPPVTFEGRPSTNDNSSLQFGQELGESAGLLPGLYKPAVPDPQHDTWTSSFRANSLEAGPPSPPRTSEASSSSFRPRTGIVFSLQPRQRRPDTYINVEAAALPESAALQRDDPCPRVRFPQASHELQSFLDAKGTVNALQHCTAQPNAHLHRGAGVFYKQTGINKKIIYDWYKQKIIYDWYKQINSDWYKQSCQCVTKL